MADKRISQLVERTDIANNDVLPIVASGATTTNKVTISTIQDWMQDNLDVGVTSVGLSMPSAFTVTNSPVTTSGNISVVGAGTVSQYIRGDGSLADFPQGGGGGGASVNYYLNGSVSQGTIGGIAYYEMNKTPILGTGTDFVAIADGYLASFITDVGDPSLLQIPGGNWNFETYFSASSGGGTPTFYVELYKVDSGGTATLIASNSGTPELIAFGNTITPYFSTLAVPTTTLALTDRLALRYYVARSGRTITMHTENSHLCQIITTFTTGLTALNGLTAQVQNFATGTSGSDFNISSSSSTHTFNLPNASDTARGVVTTGTQTFAGYKIFNGTIGVNNDLQLVTVGTALNTFIKNINSTGLTSIGSNGFGFNNANNIYFSGSSKGGGVFAFSNTGTQTYTLQDASGTLAFTSQIPTNPVGGTGAAGRVAYWNGSGTITSDSLFQWNDTFKRLGIGRTPTVSLDVEGAGFFSGALGVGGALNGTSASFSGTITSTITNGLVLSNNISTTQYVYTSLANSVGNARYGVDNSSGGGLGTGTSANSAVFGNAGNADVDITTNNISRLKISSTGAATFSSSVNLGTNANSADSASLNIKQAGTSYNQGIYIERGGERNGYHIYIGGASDSLTFRRNYFGTQSDVMSLTRDGNVGIGTASPDVTGFGWRTLTIKGGNNSGDAGVLELQSPATTGAANLGIIAFLDGSNRNAQIAGQRDGATNSGLLSFTTWNAGTGAERMRITSGGYLKASSNGVYNDAAGSYHEMRQTGSSQNIVVFRNGGSDPYGVDVGYPSSSPNNTVNNFIYCFDSTAQRFSVRSNGGIANYSANDVNLSDERTKKDIEPLESYWDKFKAIEIVKFKYKDQTHDDFNIGVIAQQVESVAPEFVDVDGWGKPELDEEGNEIISEEEPLKSIYTADLNHATIKVLQEAMTKIEKLEEEISSLKNQIK